MFTKNLKQYVAISALVVSGITAPAYAGNDSKGPSNYWLGVRIDFVQANGGKGWIDAYSAWYVSTFC